MNDELWMISVDDHVVEPAGVWQERVPRDLKAAAPRVVPFESGLAWEFGGQSYPINGKSAVAGRPPSEWRLGPVTYDDMRPGAYDPIAREQDMLADGVLASMLFPTFPRFCGQLFSEVSDKRLGLACIEAYNDWMIDDWCASAPGRYIPLIIIPLWDPQLAAKEIVRGADRGARAVAFSENPAVLGFPSIHDRDRYWDPVFAAASDAQLPLCAHLGSSSRLTTTSRDAPAVITPTLPMVNSMCCLADWMFSGHFQRFPSLRLCLSEGGIGWIPVYLDRVRRVVETQAEGMLEAEASGLSVEDISAGRAPAQGASASQELIRRIMVDPYELFRDHVYGCFIDDPIGLRMIDLLPADNLMIETDYPHPDSSFPNSRQIAVNAMAHLDPATRAKVLRENAQRVFRFEPAPPP